MGRSTTWLVAVAVGGIALAAVVDSVVGRDGSPAGPQPRERTEAREMTQSTTIDTVLRDRGLVGTLVYADDDCELHAVGLPDLRPREAPSATACAFATSPGGAVGGAPSVPAPREVATATCETGTVELRRAARLVGRARGCAPAWRPDGTLTAIRSGEVVALQPRRGRLVGETLVSLADLRRGLARPPWALVDPHAREVVWLDDDLAAVVVSDPGRGLDDVIALFRGRRLVAAPPFPYERLSGLRVSPRGSYVAARIGTPPTGVLVLNRRGALRPIPFRIARAIAWSRDERWAAAATASGIYVWQTRGRGSRFVQVPVEARDVVWR